jgi:hypothetical protein
VQPYLDSHFGGVRIEDDYVITATGNIEISTAPKTVEAVEAAMASSPHSPQSPSSTPRKEMRRRDLKRGDALAFADIHRLPEATLDD